MKIAFLSFSDKRKPADLFLSGYFENEKPAKLASLEPSFSRSAASAVSKKRFEGKFGQLFTSYNEDYSEAPEIVLFGLGQKKNHKKTCMRKASAQLIQIAKARKAKTARIYLDSFVNSEVTADFASGALAQALSLVTYEFDKYKSKKGNEPKKVFPETVEILTEKKSAASTQQASEKYTSIAEGVLFARNLINEPANIMTPKKLASLAEEMARKKKILCNVLGESELKQLKMGGILGVNQGSTTPPALIVLEYGKRFQSKGTVCLVGKGVTFDTGGISIKPAKDMEKMKYDMSGAATVIATLGVVADLELPLHVVGLAPAVENNVAEDPQRPGDIITMHNGKTVEVINTDAEGRLILGDALSYSAKYKPDAIIDLATLTGMCAYTFGDKAIGLMGTNEKLVNKIKTAGDAVGERCWELPLWDDYADQIKGHHSDLLNVGGPYGGTITAAMFLKEFVPENTPWAHLDIAGTAWADSNRADCPKGATGVGVRLLTELLSNWK